MKLPSTGLSSSEDTTNENEPRSSKKTYVKPEVHLLGMGRTEGKPNTLSSEFTIFSTYTTATVAVS